MAIFLIDGNFRWTKKDAPRMGWTLLWRDSRGDEFYAPGDFSANFKRTFLRLACLGRGSTVAYYLNAAGRDFDHRRTAIFGVRDAWNASERGDGFINHEPQQIQQWGKHAPAPSKVYVERSFFERQNQAVLEHVVQQGGSLVEENVVGIRRWGDCYHLTTESGKAFLAAKVILATGAGPHISVTSGPSQRGATWADAGPIDTAKVMDLDTFMQRHPRVKLDRVDMFDLSYVPRWNGRVVAIHGTNAGIDAAMRAWQYGYDVLWFGTSRQPTWLSGHRLPIERLTRPYVTGDLGAGNVEERDPIIRLALINYGVPVITPVDDRLRVVTATTTGPYVGPVDEPISMYIISVGQDIMGDGAAGDIISKSNIDWTDLEPIYDTNQIFGQPYQTILGFQVKGTRYSTGLQILGAAAGGIATARLPKAIPHNYRQQYAMRRPEVGDRVRDVVGEGTHVVDALEHERRMKAYERHEAMVSRAETYLAASTLGALFDHQVDPTKVPAIPAVRDVWAPESTPEKPAATAVASVAFGAQLSGVKSTMAALHGFIPEYIAESTEVNFTSDDRTMLAVYIAKKYPNISSRRAQTVVNRLISQRRHRAGAMDGTSSPLGYLDWDIAIEEAVLRDYDRRGE